VLHITNGDSAAQGIRDACVPGHVLPWRDVLHEGPVPQGITFDQLRVIRARFLAASGWSTFDEAVRDLSERDRALAESLTHEEVVLWFEHDLYDQLQLLQLLDWFAGQAVGATRLSLICAAEYLGPATPDRLRERFPTRQPLSTSELELGQEAWTAFRSSDPTVLTNLLRQDTSALPFLRDALLRHLQQFPSVGTGLSRSETQALEAIVEGGAKLGQVYASHQEREAAIFLGDTVFALYMEGLSQGKQPLVLQANGEVITAPQGHSDLRDFWGAEVRLTPFGREVLAGNKDHVKVNGIDRWLGGVHLRGPDARWRWDQAAQRVCDIAA
jgi:Domain of unknown function (DUF1835)